MTWIPARATALLTTVFALLVVACGEEDEGGPPGIDLGSISPEMPYRSHYVDVNGVRMRYLDEGTGNVTFVLVHGMPTSAYLWRNIIPHLSQVGRVVVPDLVGFGETTAPGLAEYGFFSQASYFDAFMQQLGIHDAVLVLHDWGSAVGFTYASNHEQDVRGLVFFEAMLDPIPGFEFWPPPVAEFMRQVRDPATSRMLLVDQNVMVEMLLPNMSLRPLAPEELDAYRKPFVDPARREVIFQLVNDLPIAGEPADVFQAQSAYVAWLEATTLPKLFLYATPGAATPASMVAWAENNLSTMKSVDLGDGLHFLQEDHPHLIGLEIVVWAAENGLITADVP